MSSVTSVKSGRWSDPTVWNTGSVPADGNSVTIASGHEVIFDVDQSGFPNGLAGLTINGTLRIPSQQEDPNMPSFVCLRVNANIAGSGAFIIGSTTNPISWPQFVRVMVNGTISVATFNCYGEQRIPHYDYIAQDAPANSNTITLTNGMPLRVGDIIAIGRSDVNNVWTSGDNFTYTVTGYDAATKTVTISPALTVARRGGNVFGCLVILLTRAINIQKYGSNNAVLVSGSGRYFQGVLFDAASGAAIGGRFFSMSNPTFTDCAYNAGVTATPNDTASNWTITRMAITLRGSNSAFIYGLYGTNNRFTDIACVNTGYFLHWTGWSNFSTFVDGLHMQNCSRFTAIETYNNSILVSSNVNPIVVKNANAFITGHQYSSYPRVEIRKANLVNVASVVFDFSWTHLDGYIENATIHSSINCVLINNVQRSTIELRDFNVVMYGTANLTLFQGRGFLRNINVEGAPGWSGFCYFGFGGFATGIKFARAGNPLGNIGNSGALPTVIKNLTVDNYYRPIGINAIRNRAKAVFVPFTIEGLTINNSPKLRACEYIYAHGFIKNWWENDDYSTYQFFLTSAGDTTPLPLNFRILTFGPVVVSGSITQLREGEKVRIQIFTATKEPLLDDIPEYEVIYDRTGDFSINWMPPGHGEYIVRIQAEMNQTSSPVVISNLSISAGSGESGSVVIVQANDQTAVSLSEGVQCMLPLSVVDNAELNAFESTSLLSAVRPSESLEVVASESVSAPLAIQTGENAIVAASEAIIIPLSAQAQDIMEVQTTETSASSFVIQLDDDAYLIASEAISVPMSLQAIENNEIDVSEVITTPFTFASTENIAVVADESADNQLTVSVDELSSLTASESVEVMSGAFISVLDQTSISASESVNNSLAVQASDIQVVSALEVSSPAIFVEISEENSIQTIVEGVEVTTQFQPTESIELSATEAYESNLSAVTYDTTDIVASEIVQDKAVISAQDTVSVEASDTASSVDISISALDSTSLRAFETIVDKLAVSIQEEMDVIASESVLDIHSIRVSSPIVVDISKKQASVNIRRKL